MEKKYKIEFTEKQLQVVQEACEFLSRFSAGQIDSLPTSLYSYLYRKYKDIDEYCNRRDNWNKHLNLAKYNMFNLSSNESLGIGNPELTEQAKIAYDIYRPILEVFAKESDSKSSVYFYEGLTYSKEGRIKIETNKGL
jgi:hypothetical protein